MKGRLQRSSKVNSIPRHPDFSSAPIECIRLHVAPSATPTTTSSVQPSHVFKSLLTSLMSIREVECLLSRCTFSRGVSLGDA